MSEFNQTKYINDFIKEKYDVIKVQFPKGYKDILQQKACEKGFKYISEYIRELVQKDMES